LKIKGCNFSFVFPTPFRFECQKCGKCEYMGEPPTVDLRIYGVPLVRRYRKGNLVPVFHNEIVNICKNTNLSPHEVADVGPAMVNAESKTISLQEWSLKQINSVCRFWDNKTKLCTIYSIRPLCCQMFPFHIDMSLSNTKDKDYSISLLGVEFCEGLGKGSEVNLKNVANICYLELYSLDKEFVWFKRKEVRVVEWLKYPYPHVEGMKIPQEPMFNPEETKMIYIDRKF